MYNNKGTGLGVLTKQNLETNGSVAYLNVKLISIKDGAKLALSY